MHIPIGGGVCHIGVGTQRAVAEALLTNKGTDLLNATPANDTTLADILTDAD